MDKNGVEGAPGKAEGVEGDARKLAGKAEGAIGGVTGGTKMQAEGRVHEVAVEGRQKSIDAKDTSVEAGGHLLRRGCTGSWAWIGAKERNSSGAGYLDIREINSATEPFCYGHAG